MVAAIKRTRRFSLATICRANNSSQQLNPLSFFQPHRLNQFRKDSYFLFWPSGVLDTEGPSLAGGGMTSPLGRMTIALLLGSQMYCPSELRHMAMCAPVVRFQQFSNADFFASLLLD